MTDIQCRSLSRTAAVDLNLTSGVLPMLQRLPAILFGTLLGTLMCWQERAKQRSHLATLDDHLLRDMGLTRAAVEREIAIPFWRES